MLRHRRHVRLDGQHIPREQQKQGIGRPFFNQQDDAFPTIHHTRPSLCTSRYLRCRPTRLWSGLRSSTTPSARRNPQTGAQRFKAAARRGHTRRQRAGWCLACMTHVLCLSGGTGAPDSYARGGCVGLRGLGRGLNNSHATPRPSPCATHACRTPRPHDVLQAGGPPWQELRLLQQGTVGWGGATGRECAHACMHVCTR